MESPHPDERPLKKRRFFTEDSSPAQVRSKTPNPLPSSPPPQPALIAERPDESNKDGDGDGIAQVFGSFDVGMLQAVVGELSVATMQKLKDVSGSDVQRGRQTIEFNKRRSDNR
jgi:DNA repair protein RAD5